MLGKMTGTMQQKVTHTCNQVQGTMMYQHGLLLAACSGNLRVSIHLSIEWYLFIYTTILRDATAGKTNPLGDQSWDADP